MSREKIEPEIMTFKNPIQNQAVAVLLIFLAGFALRFAMITAPYNTDERKNIVIAKDIGWGNLPLEDKHVTHPLLNIYVTRLGMSLFDQTNFGVRFLHLLFGSLTLLLVYGLLRGIGHHEGLLAMFLLAFNQFHIHASIRAENQSLLFFLLTLTIWLFYMVVLEKKERLIYALGPVAGLAFLTKGVTLLLVLSLLLTLAGSKDGRAWFRRKDFHISILLFVLTICPWLLWVAFHGSSQLIFDKAMYQPGHFVPRLTALNFYLIEFVSWIKKMDIRLLISWEYGILDGISGAFLLTGVAVAAFLTRNTLQRVLLTVFLTFMLVLSFFTAPGLPWGEFWWAAPSLIPAICLTAMAGAKLARNHWTGKLIMALFIIYSVINAINFVATAHTRFAQPPHRMANFVDTDLVVARIHADRGRTAKALEELDQLRWQTPNNIDVLNYTGTVLWNADRMEDAAAFWLRAAELEPGYNAGDNYLKTVRNDLIFTLVRKLQTDPDDLNIRFLLGALAYYYKDPETAKRELTLVTQINPYHHRAQLYLGMVHFEQQNYEQASANFKAVLDSHPHSDRAHYHLGRLYQDIGEDEQAIKHFEAAVTLNPDDANSYYELSQLYQGQPTVAVPMWKKARQIYHQDIKYRVYDDIAGRYRILIKP
ncbi:MAG: glycosyltransferase family 39 protein [Anaerolineae bacterium]|nr:glycosyltransferase family 39 protein [Anaerolineae bacterium]